MDRTFTQADIIRAWKLGQSAAAQLCNVSVNDGGVAKSLAFFLSHEHWHNYKSACQEYADRISALQPPADLFDRVKGVL